MALLSEVIGTLVTKVVLLSIFEWLLVTKAFSESLPLWVVEHAWSITLTLNTVLLTLYGTLVYPYFVSPLRHLPVVRQKGFGFHTIVNDSPRGKTPLKWINANPDADMLVVRGAFNSSFLLPVSPRALRDVLSTNSYDFVKSQGIRQFLSRVLGYGLILAEGDPHKKQRKALGPAFKIQKIHELYPIMWEKTGVLLEELEKDINAHPADANYGEKGGNGAVEITQWASRLTLDIIGPVAMGKDFQSLITKDEQIADVFLEILKPSLEGLIFLGMHFVFPAWFTSRLPMRINRMLNRNEAFLRGLCYQILDEKKMELVQKEKNIADYDILSRIIQTNEFNDSELVDQMLTFLAAGHETTASALSWCCYLMCLHPGVQHKLREEIRANIPSSNSPVSWELLESLPYLNGVCEETFRLFPTVPTTIREAIRDTTVADVRVPKDSLLVIVPYAINRAEAAWGANAHEMVPERWIDTLPNGTSRPNKHGGASSNFNECTFLHGSRACIGRDFAKAELRCAVAGVVGKFAMELEKPHEEVKITGVITTKPDNGLGLKMKVVEGW